MTTVHGHQPTLDKHLSTSSNVEQAFMGVHKSIPRDVHLLRLIPLDIHKLRLVPMMSHENLPLVRDANGVIEAAQLDVGLHHDVLHGLVLVLRDDIRRGRHLEILGDDALQLEVFHHA